MGNYVYQVSFNNSKNDRNPKAKLMKHILDFDI